jgi:glycosyltransferase involved in cell wall biosynthesis
VISDETGRKETGGVRSQPLTTPSDARSAPRVAYIAGLHPALSQTFVLTEIEAVRKLGVHVETISIRKASSEDVQSVRSRAAAETTYAILPPRWGDVLGAHLRAFARRPLRYVRTLAHGLRLAPPGVRGLIWQFFYFVEAIVVWRRASLSGLRHLHAHMANVAADVTLLAAYFGDGHRGARWTWSFTMHGPLELWDVQRHRLPQKVRSARFVVCISDFTRSQLMAHVGEANWQKLYVVHCGIDPDASVRRTPYAESGLILSVGRLVPDKGFPILLEAFRRLVDDGVDARLVLAGSGPQEDDLKATAAKLDVGDRVTFTGAVGEDEVRDLYERASVFCSSSFAEGIPVVLLEAMALEVPVVATRIAGVPELVQDGVTGCLVTPGRADELAAALSNLLRDPAARDTMRRAGRMRVVEDFNAASSAQRLCRLFAAVEEEAA